MTYALITLKCFVIHLYLKLRKSMLHVGLVQGAACDSFTQLTRSNSQEREGVNHLTALSSLLIEAIYNPRNPSEEWEVYNPQTTVKTCSIHSVGICLYYFLFFFQKKPKFENFPFHTVKLYPLTLTSMLTSLNFDVKNFLTNKKQEL